MKRKIRLPSNQLTMALKFKRYTPYFLGVESKFDLCGRSDMLNSAMPSSINFATTTTTDYKLFKDENTDSKG
jgi:hypothetical protein